MKVSVNGSERELAPGATLIDLVRSLDRDPGGRGLAIAINGEVVSRSRWADTRLQGSERVEVLSATQGG